MAGTMNRDRADRAETGFWGRCFNKASSFPFRVLGNAHPWILNTKGAPMGIC